LKWKLIRWYLHETGNRPDKFAQLKQVLTGKYAKWTQNVDGNKPTLEQVLGSFSQQQLKVANTYVTPYLLMVPITDQKNSDKITGYEPVIAEGKWEMEPYKGDNLRYDLQDRILARKKARRKGESGMTNSIWNSFFLAAKKAGKPIDVRYYTMMEDDYSEGDARVPIALSSGGRPRFRGDHAVRPDGVTRFRSTVRGNVLSV